MSNSTEIVLTAIKSIAYGDYHNKIAIAGEAALLAHGIDTFQFNDDQTYSAYLEYSTESVDEKSLYEYLDSKVSIVPYLICCNIQPNHAYETIDVDGHSLIVENIPSAFLHLFRGYMRDAEEWYKRFSPAVSSKLLQKFGLNVDYTKDKFNYKRFIRYFNKIMTYFCYNSNAIMDVFSEIPSDEYALDWQFQTWVDEMSDISIRSSKLEYLLDIVKEQVCLNKLLFLVDVKERTFLKDMINAYNSNSKELSK